MKIVRKSPVLKETDIEFSDFIDRLTGPDGCDFKSDNARKLVWYCDGTHSKSKKILSTIPNIDTNLTLKYFKKRGGYCDCEVAINVDKDKNIFSNDSEIINMCRLIANGAAYKEIREKLNIRFSAYFYIRSKIHYRKVSDLYFK